MIFFSLILSLSRPILAWKEAIMMFFNFFNFFAIFLQFPIPGRVGMDQNENFFFLTFLASPAPFWLEKKPCWCFLIFLIFLLFFWNSLFRVGLEWIRTRIFFSHVLSLSRPVLAWKEAILMFFNFLNFFAIFLRFPIPGRVGMDQNENFFFSPSQPIPSLFGLKRSHIDVF